MKVVISNIVNIAAEEYNTTMHNINILPIIALPTLQTRVAQ